MFSNKNEMVKYCRQKNIRKYSSLNRPELLLHIIKSVYFRALKDYGNKRAYEELRDTYHSKTEEYKDKIKILEEKIINSEFWVAKFLLPKIGRKKIAACGGPLS